MRIFIIFLIASMATACTRTAPPAGSAASQNVAAGSLNNAQSPIISVPQIKADDPPEEVEKLKQLYNDKNCRELINAFPSSFEKLNQVYGYEDGKGGQPLFSNFAEHFSYFFECSEVSDREKLQKVIEIGIGGQWEADAIETFQDSSYNLIKKQPHQAKIILDNLPDEKAGSFWYFLLDGPHPNHPEKIKQVDLLSNLFGQKSKQVRLLKEQYQKIRKEWKED